MTIDERTIRINAMNYKGSSAGDLRNKVVDSLEELGYEVTLDDMTVVSRVLQGIWDQREELETLETKLETARAEFQKAEDRYNESAALIWQV